MLMMMLLMLLCCVGDGCEEYMESSVTRLLMKWCSSVHCLFSY